MQNTINAKVFDIARSSEEGPCPHKWAGCWTHGVTKTALPSHFALVNRAKCSEKQCGGRAGQKHEPKSYCKWLRPAERPRLQEAVAHWHLDLQIYQMNHLLLQLTLQVEHRQSWQPQEKWSLHHTFCCPAAGKRKIILGVVSVQHSRRKAISDKQQMQQDSGKKLLISQ